MRALTYSLLAGTLAAFAILTPAVAQDVPQGYPADYAKLIEKAKSEGAVAIYTSTDAAQSKDLVDAFKKKYGINVEYNDLGTNGTYNRVISEAAAGQVGADIVWSSAMDTQVALAADGYLETYRSPEIANIPDWAVYKDMLYATTIEPIGNIYNTKAIPESEFPKTRADLIKYLQTNKDKLKGKVATFDPEKSGSGFLHHTNDARNRDDFWDLAKAMGAVNVRTYSSSGAMKESVVSGENVMAINIIGSYAIDWVKDTPNLGVNFSSDYTAAFSRLAGIAKNGPHPNAAKLFLDFTLSKEGQSALAKGGLPSVRKDVDTGLNAETLNKRVGGNLKPIRMDDSLLESLKPQTRVDFFKKWNAALSK